MYIYMCIERDMHVCMYVYIYIYICIERERKSYMLCVYICIYIYICSHSMYNIYVYNTCHTTQLQAASADNLYTIK